MHQTIKRSPRFWVIAAATLVLSSECATAQSLHPCNTPDETVISRIKNAISGIDIQDAVCISLTTRNYAELDRTYSDQMDDKIFRQTALKSAYGDRPPVEVEYRRLGSDSLHQTSVLKGMDVGGDNKPERKFETLNGYQSLKQ